MVFDRRFNAAHLDTSDPPRTLNNKKATGSARRSRIIASS